MVVLLILYSRCLSVVRAGEAASGVEEVRSRNCSLTQPHGHCVNAFLIDSCDVETDR